MKTADVIVQLRELKHRKPEFHELSPQTREDSPPPRAFPSAGPATVPLCQGGPPLTTPVVLEDRCVGCGLCQTRCYAINVKEHGLLERSAIIIEAGEGKEDRLHTGSYLELRRKESAGFADPWWNTETLGDSVPGKSLPSAHESPFPDSEFSNDDAEVGAGKVIRGAGDDSDNPFGL